MEKIRFSKSEVLSFVEDLILCQMATQEELEWYEEVKWNKVFKINYTYKLIVKKMVREYNGI
jgi:hypothetical protein